MKGYINVPESCGCARCRHCGSAPIIYLVDHGMYQLKCPQDDTHYQTTPGIIDVEDWNFHNTMLYGNDLKMLNRD